jgi:electron transport complex protein RnfA
MSDLVWIFVSALLVNNFVLSYFLGLCPFLGVSGRLETSFRLGLATVFVMLITALCAWFLNNYVLIYAPYLRLRTMVPT